MQVVHYINGEKYDSHHDWGVAGMKIYEFTINNTYYILGENINYTYTYTYTTK